MSEHETRLQSISRCLASTCRTTGPKLISEYVTQPIGGPDKPESDFGEKVITIYHNICPARYYEFAIREPGTQITNQGALMSSSGAKTGRCPKDKRVVYDEESPTADKIWWNDDLDSNSPNYKMDKNAFLVNRETAINHLGNCDRLFVVDAYAGWDKNHRIKIRLIAERAYHAFFIHNMLVRPTKEELKDFEPDFVIFNAGKCPSNRYSNYMTSSTSVNVSLERQEVVILGTQYAGEMKKGVFSIMYYLMAQKDILTLHSSANINPVNEETTLFFGLSGTGKTTLSANPLCCLIGDDEHCWTENGVFNIEGGCYAKCIDLSCEKEPDIFNAIKFGTLLENVVMEQQTREVDYSNVSITMNTRASYPIEYTNAVLPCVGGHPSNIIFLTFDAFGVLPVVSKLNIEQAMYHFISGYTSKIAGTEDGITEPVATFSACYGQPFLLCHPFTYAEMLCCKINKHNVNVWLINTGWIMGKYGDEGSMRCPLKLSRKIVNDIQNGTMNKIWKTSKKSCMYDTCKKLSVFRLEYLAKIYDKDMPKEYNKYLDPLKGWKDLNKYKMELNKLGNLMAENFERYMDSSSSKLSKEEILCIKNGGPVFVNDAIEGNIKSKNVKIVNRL